MPIWLRRYTYQEIYEYHEEQNKKNKGKTTIDNKVMGPAIKPDYTTKASK